MLVVAIQNNGAYSKHTMAPIVRHSCFLAVALLLCGSTSTPSFAWAKKQSAEMEVARLYGSIEQYAYYFVDILVGTPPQRQSVILDSGSSLLAFPCKGCDHCGNHIDAPFDFSLSTTSEWLDCKHEACYSGCGPGNHCHYSQAYSEGSSIAGHYFKDVVALGDIERNNPFVAYDHIGCHTKETKLFTTQKANGIMGVSYPKGGRQTTIMDVLFGRDNVNTAVFAICLAANGGLLTVGGFDASMHVPGDSYGGVTRRLGDKSLISNQDISTDSSVRILGRNEVPIAWMQIRSQLSYTIHIVEMSLNGRSIGTSGRDFGDTVVDSGTTYSYFPPNVYNALTEEFSNICSNDNRCKMDGARPCWKLPKGLEDMKDIPSVSFKTEGGAVVEWGPRSYLYKGHHGWCTAIDNNRSKSSLLGMSFMKNKNVIFDRDRDRIGVVDADCPEYRSENRPPPPPMPDEVDEAASEEVDEEEAPPVAADAQAAPVETPVQDSEAVAETVITELGGVVPVETAKEEAAVVESVENVEGDILKAGITSGDAATETETVEGSLSSKFLFVGGIVFFVILLSIAMLVIVCSSLSRKRTQYQTMDANYVDDEEPQQVPTKGDTATYPGEVQVHGLADGQV